MRSFRRSRLSQRRFCKKKKKKEGEEEKINHCLAISNSKIMTFTYILVADCTLLLT